MDYYELGILLLCIGVITFDIIIINDISIYSYLILFIGIL